ncbi:uncharacterized protein H6S33_008194, partial [Morchella sextelata]|uniref:uncharacterized protein n=1 Tax=Morchella sextelata TaxID=1174677 RepID=UPI001D03B56E
MHPAKPANSANSAANPSPNPSPSPAADSVVTGIPAWNLLSNQAASNLLPNLTGLPLNQSGVLALNPVGSANFVDWY